MLPVAQPLLQLHHVDGVRSLTKRDSNSGTGILLHRQLNRDTDRIEMVRRAVAVPKGVEVGFTLAANKQGTAALRVVKALLERHRVSRLASRWPGPRLMHERALGGWSL